MGLAVSDAIVWAVILAIAIGTYAFRASFIVLFGYLDGIPPALEETLRYVPPAALAALVGPALLAPEGTIHLSPANETLAAGAVAVAVAYRTGNMLATILGGMLALYALGLLPV